MPDDAMRIAFVVPGPIETISGGYAYDRAIIEGLRGFGHLVETVPPDAFDAVPEGTRVVIDGLGLPLFDGRGDALAARRAIGLIHHPTALETGGDEAARAQLRAIETVLFSRLARIIVTSKPTADRLVAEFGVSADKIDVVMPGTADAPRSTGSGGPGSAILSVGTLVPRKGHDLLLRALARLFDLDWHLTIVGSLARDPVHAHTLAALAEELQISQRVTFAGEIVPEALDALWQRADLFALATHFEGYGMAVAEAVRRGLPCVVTDTGAARDLVPMEAGIVCPVGERDQVSKSLRRAIFGTALRRDMAEAAWQAGRRLPDWTTQARAFEAVLQA